MSDKPFTGRTAVITGASRGIGAGLVRCFREAGVRVAGCSRTLPEGCDIAQEVDVVSESAVTGFCEEVKINNMVNHIENMKNFNQ